MKIIRNEARITYLRRVSLFASLAGLGILSLGLYFSLRGDPNLVFVQWVTLMVGIIIWQLSLNFTYKYVRRPRPDQVLDEGLKAAISKSFLYHFILPANHVLLTRAGPIVIIPLIQSGKISVGGENGDKWRRKGAWWRRLLGQEPPLGNPTREAEKAIGNLVNYVKEHAPELEELPIGAIIVFLAPASQSTLDLEGSRIPAVHVDDLKKFIRKHVGRPLPHEQYKRLRKLFQETADEKLGGDNDT